MALGALRAVYLLRRRRRGALGSRDLYFRTTERRFESARATLGIWPPRAAALIGFLRTVIAVGFVVAMMHGPHVAVDQQPSADVFQALAQLLGFYIIPAN
jgi:hypothetical protein